ncbi:hypothetical protein GH714_013783 [Hevea brasiliensis]|uniref:Retrotransposon gag domain-containing protein n=1 Tax=Hevea brasiliensis TaxID=3981 RepID=A0A6A6N0C6_HEVBR|nr:hypothetical protein GH714_013783 [Hevea brasiliensis]
MADIGDQEQAGATSMVDEPTVRGRRKGQAKSREPSRARDEVGDLETRLAKIELHLVNEELRFEEMDNRLLELAEGLDDTRVGMQAALNEALGKLASENEVLKIAHAEEVSTLREENRALKDEVERVNGEVRDVKDELVLLKRLVAQNVGTNHALTIPTARVDVPKPGAYLGARSARDIDNFLWSLEQYFRALGIEDDARKVDHAPLYLAESAMVWWRRRMADVEKGTCSIKTWSEFKMELKKQFYPENAAYEARAKLRRLTQNETIRGYVKEFSELLLEIPEFPDQEALFFFKDGLQPWVKLEIERRGAQDLATAIAIAESLVEFKKADKVKNRDSKGKSGGDRGGDKESNQERLKEGDGKKSWFGKKDSRDGKFKQYGKPYQQTERPPLKCFLCEGPHRMMECPKNAALTALVEDKEDTPRQEESSSMGAMKLAALSKGKQVESKVVNKGKLFAQLRIGQNEVQALVDTGASDNFLKLEEAQKMGIAFSGQGSWLKAVNSKPIPTHGVATNVAVKIGEWAGHVDFCVVSMDDYSCVLGMSFMDRVKAIPMPFANSMCILEDGKACTVPLKRGRAGNGTLSAMHLSKEVKRTEPSLQVALQAEKNAPAVKGLHEVKKGLQQPKKVTPKELWEHLPPKKKVGRATKLLPCAQSPARMPLQMAQFSKNLQGTKATGASPLGAAYRVKFPTQQRVKLWLPRELVKRYQFEATGALPG